MSADLVQRLDVHELITELTSRHTHREKYAIHENGTWWAKNHVTRVPGLIEQLQTGTPTGTPDGVLKGFESKPAAWLEGIDTLARIDLEAARWIRDLGEDDDETDTAKLLRKLYGLYPSAHKCQRPNGRRGPDGQVDCCSRHAIEADVHRWWLQARIITGWESPAWRPANTCPACGARGKLRVRFAPQGGFCVECRTTWDEVSIGLLAEHIRTENVDLDSA
jgi:hypothetical protein